MKKHNLGKKGKEKMNSKQANTGKTVSGFEKDYSAQQYTLRDKEGRVMAILSGNQGKPVLSFYNGKGKIGAWFTLDAEGKPDIRFYDENGEVSWQYPGTAGKEDRTLSGITSAQTAISLEKAAVFTEAQVGAINDVSRLGRNAA
jgi:hypothetical protein